ncbi:hypothetical protein EXS71_03770 [Candidatus Uhrbacteria bacterium]|nr:hypothetical protein [Candidatus Uhrbacteria bacterium]
MAIFLRILLGIAIAFVGFLMVLRTAFFIEYVGTIYWAEVKFGSGGTNLFYKLLGTLVMMLGFMVATNLWEALLGATLGSLFTR